MKLRSLNHGLLLVAVSSAALAQKPDDSLTFEVATVKSAAPPSSAAGKMMMRIGVQGGPGSSDPGQISYWNLNLRTLLTQAYGVRPHQISGPAWLDGDRFDIVAKVPRGATKDDVKVMLRNLIRERFQLAFHREQKEQPVYTLVAAKGAPKLAESADQSDPDAAPSPTPPANAAAPSAAPPDPSRLKIGKDGMPEFPAELRRPGIAMMAMMSPRGPRMKLIATRQTMAQFADSLSTQTDRAVVDKTGLTARYDFTLDFAPDANAVASKLMMSRDGMMPLPPGGDALPAASAPESDAETIYSAVQKQLGLRLEPQKAEIDFLVIDHVERTPAEN